MQTNQPINKNNNLTRVFLFSTLFVLAPFFCNAADFAGKLKSITITDPGSTNVSPKAVINYTKNGETVNFDASGSTDPDGTIIKYYWDFGDNTTGTGASISHQFTGTESSNSVTLTVEDDKGGLGLAQKNISVPTWLVESGYNANWTLLYVDSEQLAAKNAFDGDEKTIWHTEWTPTDPPYPHEIQIDIGSSYNLHGLRYLPRRDGSGNGQICQYELYVSDTVKEWGTPVSSGTFSSDSSLKEVSFVQASGRYVRFRALAECNNNMWASAAEIDIRGELATTSPTIETELTVSNLSPSNYQSANLTAGDKYYIDRDYILTSIPQSLEGALCIKAANNDKYSSSPDQISFEINLDATVYVAYDSRATIYPSWLTENFSQTTDQIETTDVPLTVWKQNVVAGNVVLPGNLFGSPAGVRTNYFVLIQAR